MLTVYTNPFEGETTVSFTLVEDEDNVYLDLYDQNGEKIDTLYAGEANAQKEYNFSFDEGSVPAGTYFFRLTGSREVLNFKVTAGEIEKEEAV